MVFAFSQASLVRKHCWWQGIETAHLGGLSSAAPERLAGSPLLKLQSMPFHVLTSSQRYSKGGQLAATGHLVSSLSHLSGLVASEFCEFRPAGSPNSAIVACGFATRAVQTTTSKGAGWVSEIPSVLLEIP